MEATETAVLAAASAAGKDLWAPHMAAMVRPETISSVKEELGAGASAAELAVAVLAAAEELVEASEPLERSMSLLACHRVPTVRSN